MCSIGMVTGENAGILEAIPVLCAGTLSSAVCEFEQGGICENIHVHWKVQH